MVWPPKDHRSASRQLRRESQHADNARSTSPSKGAGGGCQTPPNVDPQSNGQEMGQQQRRKKDLEELCREDAPLLHNTGVSHAERGRALGVSKEELLGGDVFWPT